MPIRRLLASLLLLAPFAAFGQGAIDGRGHPASDPLLDRLVGDWMVERRMGSRVSHSRVHADWVLAHQFVRLHYEDMGTPSAYEAMVFIGYDNEGHRYVAHWIDVFGGRFSETLGYGQRDGQTIRFTFDYPDGRFENAFAFHSEGEPGWTSNMRQREPSGKWTPFATDEFKPDEGAGRRRK